MHTEAMREYRLDDLLLRVRLQYDEALGRYLEQIPDFERNPLHTAAGKPVVCAAQDACPHSQSKGDYHCIDCGDCRFFSAAHPESLIGICTNPAQCTKINTERKDPQ